MAIDFPNSPVHGSTYDYSGVRYTYIAIDGLGATIDPGYWGIITEGTIVTGNLLLSFDSLTSAVAYISPVSTGYPVGTPITVASNLNRSECAALSIEYPDGQAADYVIVPAEEGVVGTGNFVDVNTKQLKKNTSKLVYTVDSAAELRLLHPTMDKQQVSLLGRTDSVVGSGMFYYDNTDSTSLDNNKDIYVTSGGHRWKILVEGNNLNEARKDLRQGISQATDGWGVGLKGFNKKVNLPKTLSPTFIAPVVGAGRPSVGEWFNGACYADGFIWLAPQDCDYIVRYDPYNDKTETVDVSSYVYVSDGTTKKDRFNGVVYDGEYVWFIPSWTDRLVRIHNKTLVVDTVVVNIYGDDAYNGGIFDGEYVWCITHDAHDLVRVSVNTLVVERFDMSLTGADISLGDASFLGGSFDGDNTIWLHPRKSKSLVSVDRTTGEVTGTYAHPMSGSSAGVGYFHGATNDGRYIWFSSYSSAKLCWFDTKQLIWSSADHTLQGTTQFNLGSAFDGRFIYFTPFRSTDQLVVDTLTGTWHKVDSPLEYYTDSGVVSAAALFVNGDLFYCPSVGRDIYKVGLYDYERKSVTKGDQLVGGELQIVGDQGVVMPVEINGAVENIPTSFADFNKVAENFSFGAGKRLEAPTLSLTPSTSGLTILFSGKVSSHNNGRLVSNIKEFTDTNGFDINTTALAGHVGIASAGNSRAYVISTEEVDLAFVIDNGVSTLGYVNGVLTSPTQVVGATLTIPNSTNDLSIGNLYRGGNWDRPLDGNSNRVQIFERKLSAQEILDWNADIDISNTGSVFLFDGRDNTYQPIVTFGVEKEGARRLRSTREGLIIEKFISGSWLESALLG